MKIAFWSNAGGKSGVTSNLACISVASLMEYTYKAVLIENHYQKNRLENALVYNFANYCCKERMPYNFDHTGMSYFINYLAYKNKDFRMNGSSDKGMRDYFHMIDPASLSDCTRKGRESERVRAVTELIKEVSIEILSDSLYYIPPYQITNYKIFEYDLYGNIKHVLNTLESFADITYIDTSYQNSLSSKIILDEADLIVVNFIQDTSAIKNFFDNYSSILSKCVFLISNYHKESEININKIFKAHLINRSSVTTISYNTEYEEAVSRGAIVEFLFRNYECKRTNPNYKFIQDIREAVFMIMSHLGRINENRR